MSYIVIKMIKGNPYLYQVRSERKGNRVVQVFEKYLGRADKPNGDKAKDQDIPTAVPPIETQSKTQPQSQTDKDWRMLRSLIYSRDNGICWICHQFVPLHQYDLGHLVDRCNGGQDGYDNLAVMHKKCNQAKPQQHTIDEHIIWLLKTKFLANKTFRKFGNAKSALQS